MLSRFIRAKTGEIQRLRKLKAAGGKLMEYAGERPDFVQAVSGPGPAIIAEYKRASPSRGMINDGLPPERAAREFLKGGAAAFSVLTEEDFFRGSLEFLNIFAGQGLPVLRKDFIFDPLQVEETAGTPASALLLIVRVIQDPKLLQELVRQCFGLGLEPVVEIFAPDELDLARQAGARIILVNNRDLDTLSVDLELSRRLAGKKDSGEVWICASGIDNSGQVKEFLRLGYDAFLVGTGVMSAGSPGAKIRELCLCPEK